MSLPQARLLGGRLVVVAGGGLIAIGGRLVATGRMLVATGVFKADGPVFKEVPVAPHCLSGAHAVSHRLAKRRPVICTPPGK